MVKSGKYLLKITFFVALLMLSGCHVARFFYYNYADINDLKKFHDLPVKTGNQPFNFIESNHYIHPNIPACASSADKKVTFDELLHQNKTVAFLIIRNDSIIYEQYFDNYSSQTPIPSFSVAKSFVSALIGIAIQEGKIKSVHDPITNYLPELKDDRFKKVTIEHLLNMRAGLDFEESYANPFKLMPKFYYGLNLKKYANQLKIKEEPDVHYDYQSATVLLLSLALEKATGKKVTEYLSEKLWIPMGMESDASWSIDSKRHQTVKSFCCLNAHTRDFARFGRLYLNNGNWNGKQIVPEEWVKHSKSVVNNSLDSQGYSYTYLWRVLPHGSIFAKGVLGQYVYVNTEKKMVIVRLGSDPGQLKWGEVFEQLAKSL